MVSSAVSSRYSQSVRPRAWCNLWGATLSNKPWTFVLPIAGHRRRPQPPQPPPRPAHPPLSDRPPHPPPEPLQAFLAAPALMCLLTCAPLFRGPRSESRIPAQGAEAVDRMGRRHLRRPVRTAPAMFGSQNAPVQPALVRTTGVKRAPAPSLHRPIARAAPALTERHALALHATSLPESNVYRMATKDRSGVAILDALWHRGAAGPPSSGAA
jgi:hypothetical protein